MFINTLAYHKHQFISYDRTLELYFAGCHNNCKNCHNPELQVQSKDVCTWKTPIEICSELVDYIHITKQIHLLGGEPLEQSPQAINELSFLLKDMGFSSPIILFTGRDLEPEFITKQNKTFEFIDYVKYGKYDETYLNSSGVKEPILNYMLATTNQKIIKLF